MGRLRDLQYKLGTVTIEEQEQAVLQVVKQNEEVITNMNTDQLFQGIRSDGSDMPPYSRTSVEFYGKPEGPIRLYDEGNFYKGFMIHAEKFPVLIDSKDPKTVLLVEGSQFQRGYGENIFGLTKENQEELNKEYLKERIQQYYKSLLDL